MQSRRVIHPQLGSGELLKTHMAGYEWEVRFDSGRRYRLPAREFETESVTAWQSHMAPATNGFAPRVAVLDVDQFRARQTLEALRLGIVPVQDVDWIEAFQNYVRLHVGPSTHLLHVPMNTIEGVLDSNRFLRIHRSHIVNVRRIARLWSIAHGQYAVELKSGQRLQSGRTYSERIRSTLTNPF